MINFFLVTKKGMHMIANENLSNTVALPPVNEMVLRGNIILEGITVYAPKIKVFEPTHADQKGAKFALVNTNHGSVMISLASRNERDLSTTYQVISDTKGLVKI